MLTIALDTLADDVLDFAPMVRLGDLLALFDPLDAALVSLRPASCVMVRSGDAVVWTRVRTIALLGTSTMLSSTIAKTFGLGHTAPNSWSPSTSDSRPWRGRETSPAYMRHSLVEEPRLSDEGVHEWTIPLMSRATVRRSTCPPRTGRGPSFRDVGLCDEGAGAHHATHLG